MQGLWNKEIEADIVLDFIRWECVTDDGTGQCNMSGACLLVFFCPAQYP